MPKRYRKYNNQFSNLIIGVLISIAVISIIFPAFLNNLNILSITLMVLVSILVLAITLSIFLYLKNKERKKLRALTLANVDNMSGIEFEQYLGEMLKSKGFSISFTSISNDFGIDIIAKREDGKYGIQAKRYSETVGIDAINQAVAGMRYYKCDKSMVITNNYFTPSARQQAHSNNCELIDRNKLSSWILEFQSSQ